MISGDYGMSSVARDEAGEVKTGAFETFGAGRSGADVSCACHWATNAAARERAGHLITYKHYHLRSVPAKYREKVDVRAFGTGERIVFLPYTREVFAQTQQWTESHQLFTAAPALAGYDEASLQLSRTETWRLPSRTKTQFLPLCVLRCAIRS